MEKRKEKSTNVFKKILKEGFRIIFKRGLNEGFDIFFDPVKRDYYLTSLIFYFNKLWTWIKILI